MKSQVYVAGIGVISAIGNSVAETWTSLQQGRSGIGTLTLFDSVLRDLPVGEVRMSNRDLADHTRDRHLTRTALLGIRAAREAMDDAAIADGAWRYGIISANTVGGMDKTEQFIPGFLADTTAGRLHDVRDHACERATEHIAEALGLNGYLATVNTACSSSVNAIAMGARMIRAGMLDVVIAGGTDALTRFTLNGFNSLMILDRERCRPFDQSRAGLNLGEGAGYVVLISESVRARQNAASLCRVSGFANTNDAFHQTASSPEGRGSFHAMQNALAMSALDTTDIGYINLHGTGTVNNDLSEGTAIRRLFGDRPPRLSSTKSFTGHTLGASGGIEAVFSIMALQRQCVFPNLGFREPMPELGLTPQKTFENDVPLKHVMSNAFGFGGNCSSIIFSA